MRYYLSFGLPIVLLTIAFWFLLRQYRIVFINWRHELTIQKILYYSVQVLIKALIMLGLIIMIHNTFHSDHLLELTLFIGVFFIFSIIQSAYSLGGFIARIKYIYYYAKDFFTKRSMDATVFRNKIKIVTSQPYSFVAKLIIIIAFVVIFIPNITLFVTANILYLFFIFFLLLIAALLNNVIYFGVTALIIFQYDPVSITFSDMNWYVVVLTFMILLIGFVVETRMDNRMFFVKQIMSVKSFNFKLGYEEIYRSNTIIIYQNYINHFYYFYYRVTGLVIVYESLVDLRISPMIAKKMIQKGTQYLKQTSEL